MRPVFLQSERPPSGETFPAGRLAPYRQEYEPIGCTFHVSGDEEVGVMKRFLNIGHGSNGAGTRGVPVWRSLKTVVLILLFVVMVSALPVSARGAVSTAQGGRMTGTYLRSGTGYGVMVKSASSKKAGRKIKSGGVKLSKTSYNYDGHTKKPSVTVTFGHKKLKKNRDYTVTYKNNKRRGTAKVIVKGRGLYSGTVTKTFRIR